MYFITNVRNRYHKVYIAQPLNGSNIPIVWFIIYLLILRKLINRTKLLSGEQISNKTNALTFNNNDYELFLCNSYTVPKECKGI